MFALPVVLGVPTVVSAPIDVQVDIPTVVNPTVEIAAASIAITTAASIVPEPVSDGELSANSEKESKTGCPSSQSSASDGDAAAITKPSTKQNQSSRRSKYKWKKSKYMMFGLFDPPTKAQIAKLGSDLSIHAYIKNQLAKAAKKSMAEARLVNLKEMPRVVAVEPQTPRSLSPMRSVIKEKSRPDSPTTPPSAKKLAGLGKKTFNPSLPMIEATPSPSPDKEPQSPPATPFVRPKNPTPTKARRGGRHFASFLSPVAQSPPSPMVEDEEIAEILNAIPLHLPCKALINTTIEEIEPEVPIPSIELNSESLTIIKQAENSNDEASTALESTPILTAPPTIHRSIELNNESRPIIPGAKNSPNELITNNETATTLEPTPIPPTTPTVEENEKTDKPTPNNDFTNHVGINQEPIISTLGAMMTIAGAFLVAKSLLVAPKTTIVGISVVVVGYHLLTKEKSL